MSDAADEAEAHVSTSEDQAQPADDNASGTGVIDDEQVRISDDAAVADADAENEEDDGVTPSEQPDGEDQAEGSSNTKAAAKGKSKGGRKLATTKRKAEGQKTPTTKRAKKTASAKDKEADSSSGGKKKEKGSAANAQSTDTTPVMVKGKIPTSVPSHFVDEYRRILRAAFKACYEQISRLRDDSGRRRCKLFLELPDKALYPDYYSYIKNPICMHDIRDRIKSGVYQDFDSFAIEFYQLFNNAKIYNKPESEIYKDAMAMESEFTEALAPKRIELEAKLSDAHIKHLEEELDENDLDDDGEPMEGNGEDEEAEAEADGADGTPNKGKSKDGESPTKRTRKPSGMPKKRGSVADSKSPYARAALIVLREPGKREPLHYRKITEIAFAKELVDSAARTCAVSMNGQLNRCKEFYPAGRGYFGLTEWRNKKGYVPAAPGAKGGPNMLLPPDLLCDLGESLSLSMKDHDPVKSAQAIKRLEEEAENLRELLKEQEDKIEQHRGQLKELSKQDRQTAGSQLYLTDQEKLMLERYESVVEKHGDYWKDKEKPTITSLHKAGITNNLFYARQETSAPWMRKGLGYRDRD